MTASRDVQQNEHRRFDSTLVSAKMRFAGALLWFALAVALTGCATFRSAGGSSADWRQVTTPHFRLRTDFDEKTAVEAALKLESTRDALVSAAWPSFEFGEGTRTEV
jgi:hypothetical protein